MKKFNPELIKKILCIKPRGIGDIVLSTIILDSLHARFPGVRVDYLTEPFAKPALEHNPLVTKILTMGKTEFPLNVALRIRKEKYDLILDLWSNPRSAQITFLSGVPFRAGYSYRGRRYAYNLLATSGRGSSHSAEHNLELLKPLDIPVVSKRIHYYVSPDDDSFGKNFISANFKPGQKVIGIIPAGGWESKRCDAPRWVDICNAVSAKYDAKFLILWGPGDESDAEYISKTLPDTAVLAPKTKLTQMTGLIKNCHAVLANDSGPMHISAALGVPTIGIFGPTNPVNHGPYAPNSGYVIKEDLFCIICNLLQCPYNHECMMQLPIDKLISKLDQILQK